jgi:hypothetical protein
MCFLQSLGFLPVIYTWLRSRRQSPPVQLQEVTDKLEPQPLKGWKVLLLWIPAACDLTGTTVSLRRYSARYSARVLPNLIMRPSFQLMNVGLLYTPVSIYQMTRGALVLFVGVFSVVFLRRRLWLYQ